MKYFLFVFVLCGLFPSFVFAQEENFVYLRSHFRVLQEDLSLLQQGLSPSEENVFIAPSPNFSFFQQSLRQAQRGYPNVPLDLVERIVLPEEKKMEEVQNPVVETPIVVEQPVIPFSKISKYISRFDTNRFFAANLLDIYCSSQKNCDPFLLMGVIIRETNAQNWRINSRGAGGMAQFLPQTARGYGLFVPDYQNDDCLKNNVANAEGVFTRESVREVGCDPEKDERFHPEKAIPAMIAKMQNLLWSQKNNIRLALANYNGGWWSSFFPEALSLNTEDCVAFVKSRSEPFLENGLLVVKKGAVTRHGGMEHFAAPNDKILLEEHIRQTCSYVNAVTAYRNSFAVGASR